LRTPDGDEVTRDTRDGFWAEPWGTPEQVTPERFWALPGLVDAHAHLAHGSIDLRPGDLDAARQRATEALEAGVGLILDKGWRDLTVVHLSEKVPPEDRPDIEAAGVVCAVDGGFWEGFARIVPPGGIGSAVARAADEGQGWVKLIGDWPRKGVGPVSNFSEEELVEAVATAGANLARVAIHTMGREMPSLAVRAGVQSIEHGLFLSPDDLGALGARGGIWVPTVLQMEATVRQLGPASSGGRLLSEGLANVAANLAIAVESGVHVLTGTDLVIGSDRVANEAIRLWELGMTPAAAVDTVSGAGFRAIGRRDDFVVGEPANAVLFPEDPTVDPRVLAHPSVVIRMGRIVA